MGVWAGSRRRATYGLAPSQGSGASRAIFSNNFKHLNQCIFVHLGMTSFFKTAF